MEKWLLALAAVALMGSLYFMHSHHVLVENKESFLGETEQKF
jgi:hypothetical protein